MLWYGTVGVCMNICSTLTVQYAILILGKSSFGRLSAED